MLEWVLNLSLCSGEEAVPAKKTKTVISTSQMSQSRQTRVEKVLLDKLALSLNLALMLTLVLMLTLALSLALITSLTQTIFEILE
jgi:hypothetical protein